MSEAPSVSKSADSCVRLGLKENWRQFALLILINAFVGGMVGIERTVVPLIGSKEFGIASTTLVVSFIVSFGVVKALANLVSGQLADSWGRKLGMDHCSQRAARNQSGARLVDDGDHEDRSGRTEVTRPCRRPQRIRRLPRRGRHGIPDWLSRLPIRPPTRADLSRYRICGPGLLVVDPAGPRHPRPRSARSRRVFEAIHAN